MKVNLPPPDSSLVKCNMYNWKTLDNIPIVHWGWLCISLQLATRNTHWGVSFFQAPTLNVAALSGDLRELIPKEVHRKSRPPLLSKWHTDPARRLLRRIRQPATRQQELRAVCLWQSVPNPSKRDKNTSPIWANPTLIYRIRNPPTWNPSPPDNHAMPQHSHSAAIPFPDNFGHCCHSLKRVRILPPLASA
jgi:hypothetical protein